MSARKIPVYLTEAEWSVINYLGRYAEVQGSLGWIDTMAAVDSLRNLLQVSGSRPNGDLEDRLDQYTVSSVTGQILVLHEFEDDCVDNVVVRVTRGHTLSLSALIQNIGTHEREHHARDFDPVLPPF